MQSGKRLTLKDYFAKHTRTHKNHKNTNVELLLSTSVTRYFARQLLNKHAKNYQNVEKITKFLLSTKVV